MSSEFRSKGREIIVPILLIGGLGMILIAFVLFFHKPIVEMTPTLTGKPERCLSCHSGIESISTSHPTEKFGCVSCHGGNAMGLDAQTAHTEMVRNPSSLDEAPKYCGSCHSAQVYLVQHSIMGTYSGAISLVRRAFGLQADDTAQYAVHEIDNLKAFLLNSTDPQPVQNFATNCLNCHLYAEPQSVDYYHRSTGCASCHVLYNEQGLYQGGDSSIPKDVSGYPQQHTFTTAIPYTQCNHCHNRGNYDLRTMTFVPRSDIPATESLSGQSKRLHDYYQPIGQFTKCEWELDCVDCHTSLEIMGDGILHNNRTEAQYVQCSTCHGTLDEPPLQQTVQFDDELAMTRANLNPFVDLQVGDTILVTNRSEPLYNIRKLDDEWVLTGKATGTSYTLPLVQGSQCQQKPDEQSSNYCHECHIQDREAPTP
ncbi:MAG: multiheme c-type cytochrome [Chloroflexota bacterium]